MRTNSTPPAVPRRRGRGFTLIEVMVAVAVLGIALSAVIKAASENGANLGAMRDRTLAHWVAENRLAELHATQTWSRDTSANEGKSELAGRTWYWRVETEETPNSDLRKVTVRVSDREGDDAWLTVLEGFLVDPALRTGS